MKTDQPAGPSVQDWADASLHVTKVERKGETIYEFRKELVVNGKQHIQFVWVNQVQLRSVGIDHGL